MKRFVRNKATVSFKNLKKKKFDLVKPDKEYNLINVELGL